MQTSLGKVIALGRELPCLLVSDRALAVAKGKDSIAVIPFKYKEGIYIYDHGHWKVDSIEDLDTKGYFPLYVESLHADLNDVKNGLSELLNEAPFFDDLEKYLDELRRSIEPKRLEIDDETSLIILDEATTDIKKIHPAIGIFENDNILSSPKERAYIGVWKDVIVEKMKKNKDGSNEVKRFFKKKLFLILEDGTEILGEDDHLFDHYRVHLSYEPVLLQSGWSGIFLEKSPSELFLELVSVIREYIELKYDEFYDVVVLWSVGTYFFILFPAYPYMDLNGPKQSGKSKLLMLLSQICFNAVYTSNMSIAALYRIVQNMRATVLLDEAESLEKSNERSRELLSLLLQGYKAGAVVYRAEKNRNDNFVPQGFEVYSPKALAHISAINDTLLDRTIPINTVKTLNPQISAKEVNADDPKWKVLKNSLYTFFLRHWREVKRLSEELRDPQDIGEPDSFAIKMFKTRGREWELWRPLLVLAKLFESYGVEGLVRRVLKAAEIILKHKLSLEDMESFDMLVVRTLLRILDQRGEGFVPIKEISEEVKKTLAEEGDDPNVINSHKVGRILGKLGLEKRRVHGNSEWKLTRAVIEDLARRLGVLDVEISNVSPQESKEREGDNGFRIGSDSSIEHLMEKGDVEVSSTLDVTEENAFAECPICRSQFSLNALMSHIGDVHDRFSPLITAIDLWIDETETTKIHKFENLIKRTGVESPSVGEIDQLRVMLDSFKRKGDLQGWLSFIYDLELEHHSKEAPEIEPEFVNCPYCGFRFTPLDLEEHLRARHGALDPILIGMIAWREDNKSMLESMLRKIGRVPKVGEVDFLYAKMHKMKEKGDLQGWLDFVYGLSLSNDEDKEEFIDGGGA